MIYHIQQTLEWIDEHIFEKRTAIITFILDLNYQPNTREK